MRARRKVGTNVRREPDVGRMARGLSYPGIDPRTWVDYGTVASVGGTGAPNFEDGNAILVTRDGIEVDVVVGLEETPATCRHGTSFGGGVIVTPIRPGDHVMCLFPGGDLGTVGEIVKVLSGPRSVPIGSDRKPLFQNDRVFLYAEDVPIDLRTAGGARVLLNQDGTVQLGGDDAVEQVVLGTTYRSNQSTFDAAWIVAMGLARTACVAAFDPTTTTTAVQAIGVMLQTVVQKLQTFEQGAYLSDKVKAK